MISRMTNGSEMNVVAINIPGKAKRTLTPAARASGASQPVRPKRTISMKPAMTGETAKGRSTIPLTNRLPGNRRSRTSSHAAATPNTVLIAVAPSARRKVSLMADRASGVERASKKARTPRDSAPRASAASGAKRSSIA